MSKIKKAQTKLTILMPDAAIRLSGRAQAAALDLTHGRVGGRDGDRLIVIGSNTGSERPPAWALNLEAQPYAEVRIAGRHSHVTARVRPQES